VNVQYKNEPRKSSTSRHLYHHFNLEHIANHIALKIPRHRSRIFIIIIIHTTANSEVNQARKRRRGHTVHNQTVSIHFCKDGAQCRRIGFRSPARKTSSRVGYTGAVLRDQPPTATQTPPDSETTSLFIHSIHSIHSYVPRTFPISSPSTKITQRPVLFSLCNPPFPDSPRPNYRHTSHKSHGRSPRSTGHLHIPGIPDFAPHSLYLPPLFPHISITCPIPFPSFPYFSGPPQCPSVRAVPLPRISCAASPCFPQIY